MTYPERARGSEPSPGVFRKIPREGKTGLGFLHYIYQTYSNAKQDGTYGRGIGLRFSRKNAEE